MTLTPSQIDPATKTAGIIQSHRMSIGYSL
jgi:hypothetical protein